MAENLNTIRSNILRLERQDGVRHTDLRRELNMIILNGGGKYCKKKCEKGTRCHARTKTCRKPCPKGTRRNAKNATVCNKPKKKTKKTSKRKTPTGKKKKRVSKKKKQEEEIQKLRLKEIERRAKMQRKAAEEDRKRRERERLAREKAQKKNPIVKYSPWQKDREEYNAWLARDREERNEVAQFLLKKGMKPFKFGDDSVRQAFENAMATEWNKRRNMALWIMKTGGL